MFFYMFDVSLMYKSNIFSLIGFQTLETHLPTRPTQPTIPQESEEVYLMAEADSRGSDSQRREAYHEEDSDDDENGSHVRCAQQ